MIVYNTNLLICLLPISIGKKSTNINFISQLFFQDGNTNKWRATGETFAYFFTLCSREKNISQFAQNKALSIYFFIICAYANNTVIFFFFFCVQQRCMSLEELSVLKIYIYIHLKKRNSFYRQPPKQKFLCGN